MKTKNLFAAISVATALAIIAPAHGGARSAAAWAVGCPGMGGMSRLGGVWGQGAFQGHGALTGSLDKPKTPNAANAVKKTSATGDKAAQSVQTTASAAKSETLATGLQRCIDRDDCVLECRSELCGASFEICSSRAFGAGRAAEFLVEPGRQRGRRADDTQRHGRGEWNGNA